MRTLQHRVTGDTVDIHFMESAEDYEAFYSWLHLPRGILAADSETTGIDIFTPGFACRLWQFGDGMSSWVLPARFADAIRTGLLQAPRLAMHNATFDMLVADRCGFATLEEISAKVIDTRIYAHTLDPRGREEGGTGLGLKELAAVHVDPDAPDGQVALKAHFKENGWTISDGWTQIAEDQEDYVRYAGLDTILTHRLAMALLPLVKDSSELIAFEHKVMKLLARMERKGLLLDVPYLQKLSGDLEQNAAHHEAEFQKLIHDLDCAPLSDRGIKAVLNAVVIGLGGYPKPLRGSVGPYKPFTASSSAVLAAGLEKMGETLTKRTKTGALCVDKDILNELCDLAKDGERIGDREPNPLALAVKSSKRAGKWKSAYVDTMLELRDRDDRVHAKINSLQARTGRMSINRPPFQQLPSSGRTIRDGVIADPGHLIISCDYSQVELRVLAAMADETNMKKAIADGKDLHDFTATMIYGEDFSKQQRKYAKIVGLGQVYGGGARTLAAQSGAPLKDIENAVAGYKESFPGVKEYGRKLEALATRNNGVLISPIGRRLPLDDDRLYAGTNYMVQSTARDLFAQALLDLDAAGLGDYLLLPIHDEVLAQAPLTEAEEVAKLIEQTMSRTFMGVEIAAEADLLGHEWGGGYRTCVQGHEMKYRILTDDHYCPKCGD